MAHHTRGRQQLPFPGVPHTHHATYFFKTAPPANVFAQSPLPPMCWSPLRYVGMVTIILNDYPALKYVLVAVMGLFVLTNKE